MCTPGSGSLVIDFMLPSIENLEVEGKQKVYMLGGVPPCVPP
jgi:hypothetical protein